MRRGISLFLLSRVFSFMLPLSIRICRLCARSSVPWLLGGGRHCSRVELGWINPGLMVWSPQPCQPQHVQHSCSVILRAVLRPPHGDQGCIQIPPALPLAHSKRERSISWAALEAFYLKMLGRFPCISEEECPSCYCLFWPLASVLPSAQRCFSHLQLPNVSPSCKAKKALPFYVDNQQTPVFVRLFAPFFPSLSTCGSTETSAM